MKFRISSLLYLTAVIALLIINVFEWRHINTLESRFEAEQKLTKVLRQELVNLNGELNAIHQTQRKEIATVAPAGN